MNNNNQIQLSEICVLKNYEKNKMGYYTSFDIYQTIKKYLQ